MGESGPRASGRRSSGYARLWATALASALATCFNWLGLQMSPSAQTPSAVVRP